MKENANESAVRAVIDSVYQGWAANDADAFVAAYAPEATAMLPGSFLPNKAAIRAAMEAMFNGQLKGSRAIYELQSIRFLGPDAAVVASKGAIVLGGQTRPAANAWALETWVLNRTNGNWRVEAFHNCPEKVA